MDDSNSSIIKPIDLRQIALCDPKLAYVLYKGGMADSDGMVGGVGVGGDCGATEVGLAGWELINLQGRWDTSAVDQLINAQITGIVETDLWIRSVRYTVERPDAYLNNIFKGQSDYYNSLQPGIHFSLNVNSYARYIISQTWTPLQNIVEQFSCTCPAGLVLGCSANIQAMFRNIRAQATPTIATITFSGVRLPLGSYGACQSQNAIALMRELGYLK